MGKEEAAAKKVIEENWASDALERQGLYPENRSLCPYEGATSVLSGSR